MKQDIEIYYTPQEVSKILKVAYMTVYRWIKTEKIKSCRAGKQYRVTRESLENFLSNFKK